MKIEANTPEEYIDQLPIDRQEAMKKLRATILENLPPNFEETMNYGMIGYVVPHSEYPKGYHCDPKLPLPFINIASQKNYIAFYHMALISDPEMVAWFQKEYPLHCPSKLDMARAASGSRRQTKSPLNFWEN